jgi:hypothetical protein
MVWLLMSAYGAHCAWITDYLKRINIDLSRRYRNIKNVFTGPWSRRESTFVSRFEKALRRCKKEGVRKGLRGLSPT